jgi:hypothetical protein
MAFSHENYRDVDPDPEPPTAHDRCRSCRTPLTNCLNAREAFNERCCGSCQMVDTHFPLEHLDFTEDDLDHVEAAYAASLLEDQPSGVYTKAVLDSVPRLAAALRQAWQAADEIDA